VQMNVQVRRRTKALNQGNATALRLAINC
jgi:hypothetical protein